MVRKIRSRTFRAKRNADMANSIDILDYLESKMFEERDYKHINKQKNKENIVLKIPKVFSLITNIDESLKFLKALITLRYNRTFKKVILDFSICDDISMCALFLFDYIFLLLTEEARINKRSGYHLSYKKSDQKEINTLFYKMGLQLLIDFDEDRLSEKLNNNDLKTKQLRTIIGSKSENKVIEKLLKSGKVVSIITSSTEIVDFFNDCLKMKGYMLSDDGKREFLKMVGEWRTNCEEHLESVCEYFCTGHFRDSDNSSGVGNLVFLNLGETIYEGLKLSPNTSDLMLEKLKRLSLKHTFNKKYDEESLWTLAAIQHKVSRFYNKEIERGRGITHMLKNFDNLSADDKVSGMAIISGNTQILFDKEAFLRYNKEGKIAFNEENSLESVPDSKYVRKIKSFYPGTLISIRFVLQKNYLEKLV